MCAYILRREKIFNALKNDPIRFPINNRLKRSKGVVNFLIEEWNLKNISERDLKILDTNVKNKFLSAFGRHYKKLQRNERNYESFQKNYKKWLAGEFTVDFGNDLADEPTDAPDDDSGTSTIPQDGHTYEEVDGKNELIYITVKLAIHYELNLKIPIFHSHIH